VLGLPLKWNTILLWLSATSTAQLPISSPPNQRIRLFPDIPELPDYSKEPPASFWQHFPSNQIPLNLETKINGTNLEILVEESKHLL
jgi:hypothetical protein